MSCGPACMSAVYPSPAAVRSAQIAGPGALSQYLQDANREVEVWLQVRPCRDTCIGHIHSSASIPMHTPWLTCVGVVCVQDVLAPHRLHACVMETPRTAHLSASYSCQQMPRTNTDTGQPVHGGSHWFDIHLGFLCMEWYSMEWRVVLCSVG